MPTSNRTLPSRLLQAARSSNPSSDAELLRRFAEFNDGAAFAQLVERHGPMVLGVCRRLLGDVHSAEDAFQAAFLALVRNARRVRNPGSLAAWLYGTAVRVAFKARRQAVRSRIAVRRSTSRAATDPLSEITGRELVSSIDEELTRLPEGLRAPVVLCCLEGLSQEEAARRLGSTPGSVRGRLERGRERLRARLARRGITWSAAAGAVLIGEAAPAVPPDWFARAVELSSGKSTTPVITRLAAAAAPSGLASKSAAIVLLALAASVVAAVGIADPPPPVEPKPPVPAAAKRDVAADRFGDPLPAGTVARLGTIRQRHGRALTVWFAPDGKTVHAFGDGPSVRTWDAATGALVDTKLVSTEYQPEIEANFPGTMHMGYSRTQGNAVSADGRVFAARSIDLTRQRFFDLNTGKLIREVKVKQNLAAHAAGLSADGNVYVASEFIRGGGTQENAVRAYDVRTGTVRTLFRTEHDIKSIFVSPDGKRMIAARSSFLPGEGMECWDVEKAEKLWSHKTAFMGSCLSSDGQTVIGVQVGDDMVQALDAATGRRVGNLKLPNYTDFVAWKFSISVDSRIVGLHGSLLTLTSSTERLVWDTSAGKLLARLPGAYGPLAVAPDGKSLVTAGESLQRWNAADGKALWPDNREDGHSGQVRSVRFAPDGRKLVSSGCDATVRVWDVATGVGRHVARGGPAHAVPPVFTPDNQTVVTRGELEGGLEHTLDVRAADTGRVRHSIRVIDAAEGARVGVLPYEFGISTDGKSVEGVVPINGIDSPSMTVLARWDLATGKYLGRTPMLAEWDDTPLPPDRRTVVTSDRPYSAELLDFPTGARKVLERNDKKLINERLPVVSPDGRLVAAPTRTQPRRPSGPDGWVAIWETTTGRLVDRLPVAVGLVEFTPDGRGLLVADFAGVGVWDLVTRERVVWYSAHSAVRSDFSTSFVSCWDVTRDGRTLATGHPDGTILLWDISEFTRRKTAADLSTGELERHWEALAGDDATKAHEAVRALAARPQSLDFLRRRLRPVRAGKEAVGPLIVRLDAPAFADREAATKELSRLGDAAVPEIRRALAGSPSAELKQRLEKLLAEAEVRFLSPGERLRAVRAVGALEWMGTTEAQALLAELSGGDDRARLTREARAAVERIKQRSGGR